MISKQGRKVFFVNPPNSLKSSFLEYIFKKEFEIYLLENCDKVEALLKIFHDAIIFVNIDEGEGHTGWIDVIEKFQKEHKEVIVGVFSSKDSNFLKQTLLMDIGVKGGVIHLAEDSWKTIELIEQVLEFNEARGRRKSVRLDFDSNEIRNNLVAKVFTTKGYLLHGAILSFSSSGLLLNFNSKKVDNNDTIERVVFKLNDKEYHIKGHLLKRFDNGNVFVTFEDILESDKDDIQTYIYEYLQKNFKRLLDKI